MEGGIHFLASDTDKIDSKAVLGLAGTPESLAYRLAEVEEHFHNVEYWFGDGGSNDLADNLTEIQLTAGTGEDYGSELQIHDGSTVVAGTTMFDLHRILVTAVSAASKVYRVQFRYGTGTFGESSILTEVVGYFPATGRSGPIDLIAPRIAWTNKVWAKVKCETNSATIDFLIGLHAYEG